MFRENNEFPKITSIDILSGVLTSHVCVNLLRRLMRTEVVPQSTPSASGIAPTRDVFAKIVVQNAC